MTRPSRRPEKRVAPRYGDSSALLQRPEAECHDQLDVAHSGQPDAQHVRRCKCRTFLVGVELSQYGFNQRRVGWLEHMRIEPSYSAFDGPIAQCAKGPWPANQKDVRSPIRSSVESS